MYILIYVYTYNEFSEKPSKIKLYFDFYKSSMDFIYTTYNVYDMYIYSYLFTFKSFYIYIYIYIYTHTHTHIYTYMMGYLIPGMKVTGMKTKRIKRKLFCIYFK